MSLWQTQANCGGSMTLRRISSAQAPAAAAASSSTRISLEECA